MASLKPLLAAMLGIASTLQAKGQACTARLQQPAATGFYSIALSPELSACLRSNLADLRIQGPDSMYVPYIIRQMVYEKGSSDWFVPFSLRQQLAGKRTIITLGNPLPGPLDALSLWFSNTHVRRMARVSGSQDGSNWFILAEQVAIAPAAALHQEALHFRYDLKLPAGRYRFYKLEIDNAGTDPIHLDRAGVFKAPVQQHRPALIRNPNPAVRQTDSSDGNSYVHISQDSRYHTQSLKLYVSGPPLYRRQAWLYRTDSTDRAHSLLASDWIQSSDQHQLQFDRIGARRLLLVIANGDNPPLRIDSVISLQAPVQLVAWLEAGKTYMLLGGDADAKPPAYDLNHFADSIPWNLPVLSYSAPALQTPVIQPEERSGWWLWLTIGGVLAALLFFTVQLLQDMKRKGV